MTVPRDLDGHTFGLTRAPRSVPAADNRGQQLSDASSASRSGDLPHALSLLLSAIADLDGVPLTPAQAATLEGIAHSPDHDPDLRARAWLGLARSAMYEGSYEMARSGAGEAAELATSTETIRHVAILLGDLNGPRAGRDLLEHGIDRHPGDAKLMTAAAWLAMDDDDLSAAAGLIEHAGSVDPGDVTILSAQARLAIMQGRAAEAVEFSRRLIATEPSFGRALYAVALYASGGLDNDIHVLDAILADPPHDSWVLGQLGATLLAVGRVQDASGIFDRVLTLAPNAVDALRGRGLASAGLGDYDAAAEYLDRAMAFGEDDWLRSVRAEVARCRGETRTAIELFDSLDLHTSEAWVSASFGAALVDDGQANRARQLYVDALARFPDKEPILFRLAELEINENADDGLQRAKELLTEAIRVDWNSARAFALLGEVLRRRGEPESALRMLDEAIILEPTYSYAIGTKGQTLRELDRAQEARPILIQAARLAPNTRWILDELVAALETVDPQGADKTLAKLQREARDAGHDIFPICAARAALAVRQHRWPQADGLYVKARELAPNDEGLAGEHVEVLRQLGRPGDALKVIESLVDAASLQWTRIDLLWTLDRLGEASDELERINAQPDPPSYALAALGELRRLAGRRAEARTLLEDALKAAPDDPYTTASLGAVAYEEGRLDEARRWLRVALDGQPDHTFALDSLLTLELDDGRADEVVTLLEGLREADPADVDIALVRAEGLSGLGKNVAAIEVLNTSLAAVGKNSSLLRTRAWIEAEIGYRYRASKSFQASDNTRDLGGDLIDLVQGLLRVGEWTLALERTMSAMDAESRYADTALAFVAAGSGLWDAAAEHAITGTKLIENIPSSTFITARAFRFAGRLREAVNYARTCAQFLPRDLAVRIEMADCLADNGEHDEARSLFTDIIERVERRPYLDESGREAHAWSLLRIGRNAEASESFLRALSATDQTAPMLFDLVACSALEGDHDQARLLLNKARDDASRFPVSIQRGFTAVALHDLQLAVSSSSSPPGAEDEQLIAILQADLSRLNSKMTDFFAELHERKDLTDYACFDRVVSSLTLAGTT